MKKIIVLFISLFIIFSGIIIYIFIQDNSLKEHTVSNHLDINSSIVQDLYNLINPSNDANVLKELYENSGLTDKYILNIGITSYLKEHPNNDKLIIPKTSVEKSIHSALGYNVTFSHQDVYILNDFGCGYSYDKDTEQYKLLSGCGGNQFESFKRKIVDAIEMNDIIQITEKSIYIYDDWNDYSSKIYIYSNYDQKNLLDYIEKSSSDNYNIEINNYLDNASTYIYTFHKQNDKYIFDSLKRVNS